MTGEREDADHVESAPTASGGDLAGSLGSCTGAVVPAVDLDHDLDGETAQALAQAGRALNRVDAHAQPHAGEQVAHAIGARLVDVEGVGHEDVVDSVVGEDLGLAEEGSHRDPGGSGVELQASELHQLVGLHVWP